MSATIPNLNELYDENIISKKVNVNRNYEEPKIFEIIGKFLASKFFEKINLPGDGIISSSFNYITDQISRRLHTEYAIDLRKYYPVLAHQIGFALGMSKIDGYYTARVRGKEVPLWIKGKKESEPSIQSLINIYNQIAGNPPNAQSHSNNLNQRLSRRLYNEDFSYLGADMRYLNGDLRKVEDLRPFYSGMAKLDLYNTVIFGEQKVLRTFVDKNGDKVELIKRRPPNKLIKWVINNLGSLTYDIVDGLLYNALKPLGPTATQSLLEAEFNAHLQLYKPKGIMYGDHFT